MGLDLLRQLRALSGNPLPAVITTGIAVTEAERHELDEIGGGPAVTRLTRPFDPDELAAEVLRSLGRDAPA